MGALSRERAFPIAGRCDPAFEAVAQAFRANFMERGEHGAAVAISLAGKPLVDLWGGYSDEAETRAWEENTLVNIFSVGKAFCAAVAMRLVERNGFSLDRPVAEVWPEFAAEGKDRITLRMVLSHRAALPALRAPLEDPAMLDWPRMTAALARERPWWTPGTAHGYHVNTFGFLVGEIVRRIDGRTLGHYLREEIAAPLGADIHIGLPRSEHHRVAEFAWPKTATPVPPLETEAQRMRWNTYWNPPGFSGAGWVNTAAWREAELPSTNGHGNARGVARFYSALAEGGAIDGVRVLSRESLAEATREHSCGPDLIVQRNSRFGLGFQLTQPERPLGPGERGFGHFGAGGSLGFCDPEASLAFGYVTNDMGPRWQNPRNRALIDAVYACL